MHGLNMQVGGEKTSATCSGARTFLEATARGSQRKCDIISVMPRRKLDRLANLVEMAQ
jgi:hypothetical protein